MGVGPHDQLKMDAIHTVLQGVVGTLFKQGPLSQAKLQAAWRIAVGDALNRVSKVCLRDDGLVEIYAADSRWQRELKRSSPLILARLNALLGPDTVKRLAVK
jgi:hypothetical protein